MYNLHTSKFPNIFKTTGLIKIVFIIDHHTPYRNIPWWSIIPPTGITLIEGTSIYLRFKIPHIGHPYNNSPHNYNRLISIFTVDTFHFRINA